MGDVIQLTPKAIDEIRASLPIKKEDSYCSHKHVQVDIEERILTCQQCGRTVDAFNFVLSWAYEERNQIWTRKELKREIDILRKEKDRLQKDIANLKAQKRNALK